MLQCPVLASCFKRKCVKKGTLINVLVRDLSNLWFSLKDDNSPTPITRGQELSGLVELHRRDDIRWITHKNQIKNKSCRGLYLLLKVRCA